MGRNGMEKGVMEWGNNERGWNDRGKKWNGGGM